MSESVTGHCLCGGVAFTLTGPISHVDACHCKMCQRWAGGPFIGVDLREDCVSFDSDDTLAWYDSSDWARRGFCSKCGSSLFYRLKDTTDFWAIAIGSLDQSLDHEIGKEIFIDEKPPTYALAGDRPRLTGAEFLASIQPSSDEAN